MAAPKKPQDHLSKDEKTGPDLPFTFEHGGKEFSLTPPSEVMTGGFIRKNRHLSTGNQFWLLIEALSDEESLAAIDEMTQPELKAFQVDFYEHLGGVDLGESQASATS